MFFKKKNKEQPQPQGFGIPVVNKPAPQPPTPPDHLNTLKQPQFVQQPQPQPVQQPRTEPLRAYEEMPYIDSSREQAQPEPLIIEDETSGLCSITIQGSKEWVQEQLRKLS